MLRRIAICLILGLLVALPAPASADFKQDIQQCNSDSNPDIKIGACTRLIQSGRFDNKNLAKAFFNRGAAYDDKGQYDRAIRDYTEAIRLRPGYADTYANRGLAYVKLGRRAKAIADFRKAIALRPGHRLGTAGLKYLGVMP